MIPVAAREVRWGTTRITYAVERSPRRRKTVAVAVEPDGAVRVKAPVGAAPEELDAIVRAKAAWIVERRRRQEELDPAPAPRDFVSGESFLYLGRQYRLGLELGDAAPRARLVGGRILVTAPSRREARAVLVDWYRGHAAERLPERVAAWTEAVGAEPAAVLLREPRKRWGSCDAAGRLRLNWRIVQAPRRLIDYVVVHELVHLLHPDHDAAFWAAVGRVLPDYEARREDLRRLGTRLVW